MNVMLEHNNLNEFILSGLGIELNVKPHQLFKQLISYETQNELDEMLELSLKKALDIFRDSDENTNEGREILRQRIKISEHIKKIANVERLVYSLHSDHECIELVDAQKEVRDFCFYTWRYSQEYGYTPIKKMEFENK